MVFNLEDVVLALHEQKGNDVLFSIFFYRVNYARHFDLIDKNAADDPPMTVSDASTPSCPD